MAKIALDAGHGLYTPGKRCLKKLDKRETREWIINDRVTDALELYLKMAGHSVLRVDDWDDGHTDVTLNDRVRKANNWKADAYISVHHNAGVKGGNGGGTVVYVSKGCQAKSIQLQEAVYKRVIVRGKLKGNRSDGTLSANFYVIRKTKMPAILIECGFMDSAVDIKHILDTDWSDQVGLGIAEGVCEVFGGSIPDQKPSKPATPSKPVAPQKPTSDKINVDGSWGQATTKALQKILGTKQDGIVSNQPTINRKYLYSASSTSWQFKKTGYSAGSNMIRALQKLIGAKADGWFGKESVKAMQNFLRAKGLFNGVVDGIMGPKTVRAWQQYINSRL